MSDMSKMVAWCATAVAVSCAIMETDSPWCLLAMLIPVLLYENPNNSKKEEEDDTL